MQGESAGQMRFGVGKSITFRHSNDLGDFAYQSRLMQLAVLAMREIGEKTITENQKGIIKNDNGTCFGTGFQSRYSACSDMD